MSPIANLYMHYRIQNLVPVSLLAGKHRCLLAGFAACRQVSLLACRCPIRSVSIPALMALLLASAAARWADVHPQAETILGLLDQGADVHGFNSDRDRPLHVRQLC